MPVATIAPPPQVEYRIEVRADLRVTAEEARRRAAVFLLDNVGNMISPGQPVLLLTAGTIRWKVPALYGLPGKGLLGQVGDLAIDVESGEILLHESSPSSVEEMERRAESLARQHNDELAAEGYRLLSQDTGAFAEAALPLAAETWPRWQTKEDTRGDPVTKQS